MCESTMVSDGIGACESRIVNVVGRRDGRCDGGFVEDFNEYLASSVDPALVGGASVWIQNRSRDPADPYRDGLSDALSTSICP